MTSKNLVKTNKSYKQLYQIGYGSSGMQVGESAALWALFARPKLLYGAEVWSASTQTTIQKLERAQAQAARRIFGKQADASIIAEALNGDLGWQSVASQIAEIKLSFYGYMCRQVC